MKLLTDKPEYSRFSSPVVKVRVADHTGAVTVSLKKDGRTLETKEVTAPTVVEFDLRTITDESGYPLCVRGDYTVEAGEESASFLVSLITADEMRKTYCFGAPLFASEILMPVKQPMAITGVTITQCSDKCRPKGYNLVFRETAKTLQWGDGPAVPIENETSAILVDSRGGYVLVDIDQFALPENDAAEGVILDKIRMTDAEIRKLIDDAIDEVENVVLQVPVEPLRVATEPYFSNPEDGEWFDRRVTPTAFYMQDWNKNTIGWNIELAVGQLKRVDHLEGYMGTAKALKLEKGAFAVNAEAGKVNVLPYNSEYAYLWTFFTQLNFWGVREVIPDFWRWKGVAGITGECGEVVKLIGYMAACSILGIASRAFKSGVASESNSKDGVSFSRSFGAGGAIYDAHIKQMTEWLDKNKKAIRNRYRGISMVLL